MDFILGILPLVRELLKEKTRVILTGNTAPALNDVTFTELNLYCDKASKDCQVIAKSLQNGNLQIIENGQKGPCLDLTNLSDGIVLFIVFLLNLLRFDTIICRIM